MKYVQVASSPALAPYAKFPYIIREIAKSMDLDPDKVTNSLDEATRQVALMQQGQPPAPAGGPPAIPAVSDTAGTGGGNIGVGQVPSPQEQGFTGNVQQQPQQQAVPPQA